MGISKEGLLVNNVINPLKSLAYKIFNAKERSKIEEVIDKMDSLAKRGGHRDNTNLYKHEHPIEVLMIIGWLTDDPHELVKASIRIDKDGYELASIKFLNESIDVQFLVIEEFDDGSLSIYDEVDKVKYKISLGKEYVCMANNFIVDACNEIDSLMPDLSNEDINEFKTLLDEFISIRDILNNNPNEMTNPQFYQDIFEFLYGSRYKTLNIAYNVGEKEISIRLRDRRSLIDRNEQFHIRLKYNQETNLAEIVVHDNGKFITINGVSSVSTANCKNLKRLTILFNAVKENGRESILVISIYMDMYLYESLKAQIHGLKEFISKSINKSLEQASITTNNDSTMPEQDNNKSGMTRIENPFDKYFLKTAGITDKDPESDEYNKYTERIKGDLAMIKSSIRQIVKSVNNYFLGTEFTNIEIVDLKNLFYMTFLEDDREMIMLLNLSALNIYASYSINSIEIKVTGKGVVDAVDVKEDNPTVNIIKGNIFINDKIVSESPEAILSFSDALEVLDYIENNIESMLKIAENRQRLSGNIITI